MPETVPLRSLRYNLEQKENIFFFANLLPFSQGMTKKIHDQIKPLEKYFKSWPIPFF